MILNQQRKVRVATRPLEEFLMRVKKELRVAKSSLTICFVSDAAIAAMNQQFRKKNGPTDVLSFPQANSFSPLVHPERSRRATRTAPRVPRPGRGHSFTLSFEGPFRSSRVKSRAKRQPLRQSGPAYLGDIAIAPETARRYAKENGRTLGSELRVLILHGVLHLLGYDHETDRGEMDRLEQRLRRTFGLV